MDEERKTTETDGASSLQGALVRLFNAHMSEVLDILSARFPHTRGAVSYTHLTLPTN